MSRRLDQEIPVESDGDGVPAVVGGVAVRQVVEHWREWIGIHDGEPQRDIWVVDIGCGIAEVHCLSWPDGDVENGEGHWVLHAWRD
jgi:hypothetical protein